MNQTLDSVGTNTNNTNPNDRISIQYDNPQIVWSQSMDMLGVISTQDHMIDVHRVGYKHQKIFSKEDLLGPTALEFTKNGQQVIIGYEDGKISVIKNDNTAEELFTSKIVDFGAPITAIHYQESRQFKSQYLNNDQSHLHIKPLHSIDHKISKLVQEKLQLLEQITDLNVKNSALVFAADASLNISVIYQCHFPIASFSIRDLLPPNTFAQNLILKIKKIKSTDGCDKLLALADVFSHEMQFQGSFILEIDSRIISSRILQQDCYLKVFSHFPQIDEYVRYLESKVDLCKSYWTKFHKQYLTIVNLLKPDTKNSKSLQTNPNAMTDSIIDMVIKGKVSPVVQKFFGEELYNQKILLLLSELRGLDKAKSFVFPQTNQAQPQQSTLFALNESIIQKLIDFVNYFFHQIHLLQLEIMESKVDLRNFFVFCNTMVNKMANSNHQQSQQTNPQEIENAKSHLARLNPDQNRLLKYLEKGDNIFCQNHISKQFEEGQFKLPIDSENQIVQGFNSEDLVESIKQLQKQEDDEKERVKQSIVEQQQHQMINISQINLSSNNSSSHNSQQQINRRTTRRSQISSGDYTASGQRTNQTNLRPSPGQTQNQNQNQMQQNIETQKINSQAQIQGFQIIPLKTLSTRVLDLIHKQMRKPLEILSPYFRYNQMMYFEKAEDSVLDMQIASSDCNFPNTMYIAYTINENYLMVIQQDLNKKNRTRNIELKCQIMQVPDGYQIKECVFHFNSLAPLIEEFSISKIISLDQQFSFKIGHFARESLSTLDFENRIPIIEFDEKAFRYPNKNIQGLRAGSRGLLNLIQDNRELIISLTENEQMLE
eukprot:403340747